MELGVRFLGLFQLIIRWISLPFYYLWSRKDVKRLPAMKSSYLSTSATQLAAKIRSGELKSENVVKAFISRIEEVNPLLNAVVEDRFSAALEEARAVDKLVASGRHTEQELEIEKPFLGVPVTVKESCCVKGLSYCVGSLPRAGTKADCDGEAVRLIRKAGAIPLVVTTTPEMCLSWETNNLVTGRTVNPYDPHRTPGGSSGGEAALVGAGASLISVASDIAGSIRLPAMYNGVFGHKPTPGYVPLHGHFPNSPEPDFTKYLVIGPLTRYSKDLKPMLKILAGEHAENLKLDKEVDLRQLKLYYMEEAGFSLVNLQVDSEIRERQRMAVSYLQKQFSIPVEKDSFTELKDSVEISCSVFFGMRGIPKLPQNPQNPKGNWNLYLELLKSLLGMSQYSMSALMFYWLKSINALVPRHKYEDYCKQRNALHKKFVEVLGDNGVFLYPTHPTPAIYHNQVYMKTAGVMYTMIFNLLGMPSTHIPLGLNKQGLPIGVQVVAAPHMDRLCLAVAQELEKGFGGWIPPPMEDS